MYMFSNKVIKNIVPVCGYTHTHVFAVYLKIEKVDFVVQLVKVF